MYFGMVSLSRFGVQIKHFAQPSLAADRKAFSDALCSLISQELSIAGDRIYIIMTNAEGQNWGWNHSTF